ncbi:hypothetical protein DFQ27_005755 [Actinomortierella ambigua]|uniref:Uncharacterized protein n=1 Tax=Actinomortierella ambigua TaxID=1343610 RepID=A0A9P6Q1H0_9FUNG|nr:hypothetical protein DFQ27_005755 [Actinomortierella ambigua]
MGFSLKSDRRSSRDLDRAVADMSLDADKKDGILAAGAAWLSSKKSSSSLALDTQLRKGAEAKAADQPLDSPQLPLNFDSLQSLTQELGSYMVHNESSAPVRVAEVCSEQPSVTVATTATIEPATATIVSAHTTSSTTTSSTTTTYTNPSFLPSLPPSPPLDLSSDSMFATVHMHPQNSNINNNASSIANSSEKSLPPLPILPPVDNAPHAETLVDADTSLSLASSQALLSNNNSSHSIPSTNINNGGGGYTGDNNAATVQTISSAAIHSSSPSLPNHPPPPPQHQAEAQEHQQPFEPSTRQIEISHQEPSASPQFHPSPSSDSQRFQVHNAASSTSDPRATSPAISLSSSSSGPSLPLTGTASPVTQPSSPTMLAQYQQQQQFKSLPLPALPSMTPPQDGGSSFVSYYVTPQGPPANGPSPAQQQQQQYYPQQQQQPYHPPPSATFQQQQQQQPYHPPPPSDIQQQHPYQPPPPSSSNGQQQPMVPAQGQPNAWSQPQSPSAAVQSLGIPSPPSDVHPFQGGMPRRSGSSTQLNQQYAHPSPLSVHAVPVPAVPVPTEDWGALLDRPDSPTQALGPFGQYPGAAPYQPVFATNGLVNSPSEDALHSRDYVQHPRQPSRSTPSPQPLNPYQSGQPLYGAPPQRSHPPFMTHQHHASTSSVPLGAPLSGGGGAAHGPQQGSSNPGDNRQGFRKSWSYGTVMNGAQQMHPPGPPGERQSMMAGYSTPPRSGPGNGGNGPNGGGNKQGPVATSVSLLTDAAIVAKYRETAIKTNDTSIQLSYAKYLLEIGTDTTVGGGDSGNNGSNPTPSSSSSSSSTNSSDGAEAKKRSSEDPELAGKRQLLQEAVYWIDRLAKEGQPEAQFIRGLWYEDGLYGTKRNTDKALRYFQSSSRGDYAPAHFKVGYYCEKRKDYSKAVILYKKAAVQNDVPANHRLAMVYLYGELNQDQNMKTGLQYLNRAASNAMESAPMSPYVLGLILSREYKQLSIPDDIAFPDDGEAFEWFKKSAELGYGPANYKLGYCYEIGALRCPIDPFMSIKYYEQAVLAGDSNGDAEMALSGWYLSGAENFFPPNESLAFQYAQRAADKGLAKAQYALGYYHEVGISVPVDLEKAMEYYKLSAAQGNKDAQKRLSEQAAFNKLNHKKSLRRIKENRKDKDKECIIM